MDTSETYIKQCEKAEEIQVLFPFECFDELPNLFYDMEEQEIYSAWTPAKACGHQSIWLPRQDQLQEMLEKNWSGSHVIPQQVFYCFVEWLRTITVLYHNQFYSMEQLWLAFTMSERYQKVWSGTDWVKE